MTIFAGGRVVTPTGVLESGWVEVQDSTIVEVGVGDPPAEPDVDLAGRAMVPGFIDQHCHGGGGNRFDTTDGAEAYRAAAFHQRHGTTSIIGSLVSGSQQTLIDQIRTLRPLVDQEVLAGIHLEGPWISKLRCGAHAVEQLRPPAHDEVGELLAVGGGRIKMVTIAPELPGAMAAIRQIVHADAIAAVGHTDADYETTREAIEAGARVATHLMNAMRALKHRDPGPGGALMEDTRVNVELVADGIHVHRVVLNLVVREAGQGRVSIITDAMSAAGCPDGPYKLGALDVNVVDGIARLESGTIAGSTLTMDAALRYLVLHAGLTLSHVVPMLSGNPARTLGLQDRGEIVHGKRADLVILSPRLQVEAVMVRGEVVHTAEGSTLFS